MRRRPNKQRLAEDVVNSREDPLADKCTINTETDEWRMRHTLSFGEGLFPYRHDHNKACDRPDDDIQSNLAVLVSLETQGEVGTGGLGLGDLEQTRIS